MDLKQTFRVIGMVVAAITAFNAGMPLASMPIADAFSQRAATYSRPTVHVATAPQCSALTLTLRPGLNPPPRRSIFRPPSDSPRGLFRVSVPLFAGAVRVRRYVATPFQEVVGEPYLQTASAEFRSAVAAGTVRRWLTDVLKGCGWSRHDYGAGNASAFTLWDEFVSEKNEKLRLVLSYAVHPNGGSVVGYGIEETVLPKRTASSFLRGRFVQLRIDLAHQGTSRVEHIRVLGRTSIARLVAGINAIRGAGRSGPACSPGLAGAGPARLTFVRANGTAARAFARGPRGCNGLIVNGIWWLHDPGRVWSVIMALSRHGQP